MPLIRNSSLIKKFTDFFKLKVTDSLSSEAGRQFVPVITHPILPLIVTLTPNESEFSSGIVVPAGKKWKVKQIHFTFTSDVNAGNRELQLRFIDGGANVISYLVASRNFQAASLIVDYNFGVGLSHVGSSSGLHQTIPLPDFVLLEGSSIQIVDVNAIAVGDTIAQGYICIEEEDVLEDEVESNREI